MIPVIKLYKIWFSLSGLFVALSIVAVFLWGLRGGIDFRGGSLSELKFSETVGDPTALVQDLNAKGFDNIVVQQVNDKTLLVKTESLDENNKKLFGDTVSEKFGKYNELRFESIGPTLSRELIRKAYYQISLVVLGILLYVAYAFRKVSGMAGKTKIASWKFGLAAIVALLHDVLITIGLFAVLGKFKGVEVDSLFITALLTILGFSVHDTIVVFDRIREYLTTYQYKSLAEIIDFSVNTTLARSINTSATLIFVLVAMLFFGGQTVFYFVLALLVGVIVGTYSSIFIASPLLYLWQKKRP